MSGKKLLCFTVILSCFLLLAGCDLEEDEFRIGIVDMEYLLIESNRAEQLNDELIQKGEELRVQYEETDNEEELESIYQQYLLHKEELESRLNGEINEALRTIKEENNIDIILSANSVSHGGFDITDDVIELLDEQYYQAGAVDDF